MHNPQKDMADKVQTIFRELAADRAARLDGASNAQSVGQVVAAALTGYRRGPKYPPEVAAEIGFHVADWGSDAAFVVALHMFPERFTAEEIAAGVLNLLVHVPNHLAAAAKLSGYPIEDVFGPL